MKPGNGLEGQVIGLPIIPSSVSCPIGKSMNLFAGEAENSFRYWRKGSVLKRMSKLGKKADVFVNGIREHGNQLIEGSPLAMFQMVKNTRNLIQFKGVRP